MSEVVPDPQKPSSEPQKPSNSPVEPVSKPVSEPQDLQINAEQVQKVIDGISDLLHGR